MEKEVIRVLNLKKVYRQKSKKIVAVDGISFSVKQGEILGFLGPNGAGKSTTIKIMMGLIRPTEGKIIIDNMDSFNPECRKKIGFLPENPSFIDTIKGKELLLFSADIHKIEKEEAKKKADNLLKLLALEDAAEREIRKYSKGMIQKIGFATSIIHEPDILILDEPMSGLDPIARYQFKQIFKELRDRGKTIFFSSHIIPDMEDLCDRVIIINKGRIIRIVDKPAIKDLEELFVRITSDTFQHKATNG